MRSWNGSKCLLVHLVSHSSYGSCQENWDINFDSFYIQFTAILYFRISAIVASADRHDRIIRDRFEMICFWYILPIVKKCLFFNGWSSFLLYRYLLIWYAEWFFTSKARKIKNKFFWAHNNIKLVSMLWVSIIFSIRLFKFSHH